MSGAENTTGDKDAQRTAHPNDDGEMGDNVRGLVPREHPKSSLQMSSKTAFYICCLFSVGLVTILAIVGTVLFFTGHTDISVSTPHVEANLMPRFHHGSFNHAFLNDSNIVTGTVRLNGTGVVATDTDARTTVLNITETGTAVTPARVFTHTDVRTHTALFNGTQGPEATGSVLPETSTLETITDALDASDSVPVVTESLATNSDLEIVVFDTQSVETFPGSTVTHFQNTTVTQTHMHAITETVVLEPSILETSVLETSVFTLGGDDASPFEVYSETTITVTPTVTLERTVTEYPDQAEEPASDEIGIETTIESITTIPRDTTTLQATRHNTVIETVVPVPEETETQSVCDNNTVFITVTQTVVPTPAESITDTVTSEMIKIETLTIQEEQQPQVTTITTTIFPWTSDVETETETETIEIPESLENDVLDASTSHVTLKETATEVVTVTDFEALTQTIGLPDTSISHTTVTITHYPQPSVNEDEEIGTVIESIQLSETILSRTTVTIYPPTHETLEEIETVVIEPATTSALPESEPEPVTTSALSTSQAETITTEVIDVPEVRTVTYTTILTHNILTTINATRSDHQQEVAQVTSEVVQTNVEVETEIVTIIDTVHHHTTITVTHPGDQEESAPQYTTLASALVPPPLYPNGNANTTVVAGTGSSAVFEIEPSETIVEVSGGEKRAEPGATKSATFFGLTMAVAGLLVLF